jgi:hypothetical protein
MSDSQDSKDSDGWSKDGPVKIKTGCFDAETKIGLVHFDTYDRADAERINRERQASLDPHAKP